MLTGRTASTSERSTQLPVTTVTISSSSTLFISPIDPNFPSRVAPPSSALLFVLQQFFGTRLFPWYRLQVLLGAAIDSWDRVREGAFHLLMAYPSPLPGVASPPALQPLVQWTLRLLHSPRVRESDAAALLLRLVFCKYVLGLRWRLKLHPEVAVVAHPEASIEGAVLSDQGRLEATFEYLDSLCDMLQDKVQRACDDFVAVCMDGLCHGTLLAVRYVVWDGTQPAACAASVQHSIVVKDTCLSVFRRS